MTSREGDMRKLLDRSAGLVVPEITEDQKDKARRNICKQASSTQQAAGVLQALGLIPYLKEA